ncbi:UNVERIFIED_ORG: hypothetical protein J2W85_002550 [Ensifer adhaerens]|nr:hypothetical protein [Ensifer adhaerens]
MLQRVITFALHDIFISLLKEISCREKNVKQVRARCVHGLWIAANDEEKGLADERAMGRESMAMGLLPLAGIGRAEGASRRLIPVPVIGIQPTQGLGLEGLLT